MCLTLPISLEFSRYLLIGLLHQRCCICSVAKWHRVTRNYQHYNDVIINATECRITGVWSVCSTVCSGADQGKYQSCATLVFLCKAWKGPITRKTFPFDDVITDTDNDIRAIISHNLHSYQANSTMITISHHNNHITEHS